MGLTEGGGAGAFREAARISGGALEDRLAAAMRIVYDDEKAHYEDAAAAAAECVGSADDLARMTRAIREVSIQRVRMRNEQFDFQMTDREIAGLAAAKPAPGRRGGVASARLTGRPAARAAPGRCRRGCARRPPRRCRHGRRRPRPGADGPCRKQ